VKLPISPAPSRLAEILRAILDDLSHGQHIAVHTEALKKYGAAAGPALLAELDHAARRPWALYALQHCWIERARAPVAALLGDDDEQTRQMAGVVLAKQYSLQGLARLCEPFVDDPRPAVAGFALERVEAHQPDVARMRRALQRPELWPYAWRSLPRYYAPALTPLTRKMAVNGAPEEVLAAIAALIHQHDDAPETREKLASGLRHELPHIREIAAEYLAWHGTPHETAALREALAVEADDYALAAMRQALDAIARRTKTAHHRDTETQRTAEGERQKAKAQGATAAYQRALALLDADPAGNRAAALELLRTAEPFEPHVAYPGDELTGEFVAARELRLAVQARLFGFPVVLTSRAGTPMPPAQGPGVLAGAGDEYDYRGPFRAPTAGEVMAPVRDYAEATRESYGREMEDDLEGFGGMVHVADDVSWNRDHRTVVAMADGVVRRVACEPSWGCLAVIEHRRPPDSDVVRMGNPAFDGWFCSLYGHLGPFVCVAPGQVVKKGQKIGVIGRSFTWENGGYAAHLHFAVHKGPYWQVFRQGALMDIRFENKMYAGRVVSSDPNLTVAEIHTPRGALLVRKRTTWITGYISKNAWKHARHDWVDPQEFLLAYP
jgi:murein DD-endopeptidase MepM/ murein hydrolase activator NlpD